MYVDDCNSLSYTSTTPDIHTSLAMKDWEEILRKSCGFLAKGTAGISFLMTCLWATRGNMSEFYLGGVNWDDKVFNWYTPFLLLYSHVHRHPILMVAGFGLLLTNGITSFKNPLLSKEINKIFHVLSYLLAIIAFSFGLKAVWKSNDLGSNIYMTNLYSLHSWIGMATIVLFGQNFIFGILHFINPRASITARTR